MKKIFLYLVFVLTIISNVKSQYKDNRHLSFIDNKYSINQIDYRDNSIFIHLKYTSNNPGIFISVDENILLTDNLTNKKYSLSNSYNLPIGNKRKHYLNYNNQEHFFTLEFNNVPKSTVFFDISENLKGGISFNDVYVDTTLKRYNLIDIPKYIKETPVKEFYVYFNNGTPILRYNYKDIEIISSLDFDFKYGKYIRVFLSVNNYSDKEIEFYPDSIFAYYPKDEKYESLNSINYYDYISNVEKKQRIMSVALALSESAAIRQSEKTRINAQIVTNSTSNTQFNIIGGSNNYNGYVYGNVANKNKSTSTINMEINDGKARYSAQQNSIKKINGIVDQQEQIRNVISDGYLKRHTVMSNTQYTGFINFKYVDYKKLFIILRIDGQDFLFPW